MTALRISIPLNCAGMYLGQYLISKLLGEAEVKAVKTKQACSRGIFLPQVGVDRIELRASSRPEIGLPEEIGKPCSKFEYVVVSRRRSSIYGSSVTTWLTHVLPNRMIRRGEGWWRYSLLLETIPKRCHVVTSRKVIQKLGKYSRKNLRGRFVPTFFASLSSSPLCSNFSGDMEHT